MNPIDSIRTLFDIHQADAALITNLPDIRWACGFSGSNGILLIDRQTCHFLTDGRYTEQSERELADAGLDMRIHIASGNLYAHAAEAGLFEDLNDVIVQSDQLSLEAFSYLKAQVKDVAWVKVSSLVSPLVACKTPVEINRIRAAQAITDAVFTYLCGFIKPGMTEQEIAAEIVYQHLLRGASAMSFEPIVASGPNGALPHARPTSRTLQNQDLVVIDMGCFLDGYASDMTRTLAIGEPDREALKVYNTVLEAQLAALDSASAGISSKTLDATARDIITRDGYGDFFTHSLGHGVGLQIHEWPSISWRTDTPLKPGMAITIEPGIYVPGFCGVRIEDLIVIEDGGCTNLTQSSKDLIKI